MHTILHLKADGSDAQHHQSLEKRLGQTRLSSLFTHDHWTELAVITHQDQLTDEGESKRAASYQWENIYFQMLVYLKLKCKTKQSVWVIPAWLPALLAPCIPAQ